MATRFYWKSFLNIFDNEKQIYLKEKETLYAISLGKQLAKSNNKSLKRKATILESEGWETAQSIVQQLGQKLKNTTSNLQTTHKKLSRAQTKIVTLQELLESESNSSNDNEPEETTKTLKETLQHLIIKGKLGSISGLSIRIIVTCYCCQTKSFYGNENPGANFLDIIAATGLVGGVNYEEWSTMLCLTNNALHMACKEMFLKKEILEVGFNCSWSKVREALQASAEFIYNGNYDSSSQQMEHANLINIISKITPTLCKYNILLDVGVVDLIPYGLVIKNSIINQEFRPSFANLIPDFDGYILCKECSCFLKQSPK
ncbi:841_t:CDS:2, partial [Gigaspora rosea]